MAHGSFVRPMLCGACASIETSLAIWSEIPSSSGYQNVTERHEWGTSGVLAAEYLGALARLDNGPQADP
jgi:hypothetical protein